MSEEGKFEACKDCCNRCQLTHGKKSQQQQQHRPTPTVLAFFKVMIGDFSEFLFLPPKFHREVLALGDQSTLEDMRGQQWKVKLSMLNGSLAFQQGWTKFVSEHDVKFGEILIFNYISESHFLVQIFGTCGCERLNFSTRNDGDRQKGKRSREMEPSPTKTPPTEMPFSMVETRAMKKLKALKSATPPENLNCRMTRSKCRVEATGKPVTTLEESSEDDENSRSDDLEIETPLVMISKCRTSGKVTVQGKMPCDASNIEKPEVKEKSPISTENSNYASSSRGTSDASDLPCIVVDEDPLVANKSNAEKVDGLSLTTPESPAKHEGFEVGPHTDQKACCMPLNDSGKGKDTAKPTTALASFSLDSADVAPVETQCDVEATEEQTSIVEKSFLHDKRSKSNFDMTNVPFYEDGGNSVDEMRAGRSTISPSKSSYLKSAVNKCDLRIEKDALENKASHSKLSNHVISVSNCNVPAVANVQLGMQNSSPEIFSSQKRSDAFQISSDEMDIDEGDMTKPSHPAGLLSHGEVRIKFNSVPGEEVPTTIDLPNAESISKNIVDLSNAKCDQVYGSSITGGAAIWSKCNAKNGDVAQNSIIKCPDHMSGSNMEQIIEYSGDCKKYGDGQYLQETIHSNSSKSQMIASKCEEGGVGEETREKSQNVNSKMSSDASQNPCYKNDENLVSKNGASRHETTPTSLLDIGVTETDCTAEEMNKVSTTTGGTDHSENLSTFASSKLPCDIIDGNVEDRVAGTDASNAHDLCGVKCNADASESLQFVVDGAVRKEERDVRSQTAPSNFTCLKLSKTDSHSDDVDKGKEMTNNSSYLATSFTRMQTMPSMQCSSPVNGNTNISDPSICRYSLSEVQKIVHSGNGLHSVLEEGIVSSCSPVALKACKIEPEERLDSIFSCSIDKRCQSRLELPQYLDYSVTKQRKKYDKVVVLLRDPSMRVWPVLYHESRYLKTFGSGWSSFAKANNIYEGDTCTFQVVDGLEALLQVHIKKG